jgi:hypothetical protein
MRHASRMVHQHPSTKLGLPYQAQFRVSYFDYFWFFQEMVYQYVVVAKRSKQSQPITGFEHGTFTVVFGNSNHYTIDDNIFLNVKFIQYKIEHFSLKTLQMGEVGIFFYRKFRKRIICP